MLTRRPPSVDSGLGMGRHGVAVGVPHFVEYRPYTVEGEDGGERVKHDGVQRRLPVTFQDRLAKLYGD